MAKPQVVIRRGDMFDGAKDLIVIPCNTLGGVTDFVLDRLLQHGLLFAPVPVEQGGVHFEQLEEANHIAQFAAFASSVHRETSVATPEAVHRICTTLGSFADQTPIVRLISAPLLGTGYGGLDPVECVLAMKAGFEETAPPGSTLAISAIDPTSYDMVKRALRPRRRTTALRPTQRVFISYTGTSSEHKAWVEELATQLRGSGIEARLDVWHLRPGMDLPQWMTNELSMADKVVIVSDPTYAERADGRLGGVGWETMIIQGDMGTLPPESTKYLVVVRAPSVAEGLPVYLKTKFAIHCPLGRGVRFILNDLVSAIQEPTLEPPIAGTESVL